MARKPASPKAEPAAAKPAAPKPDPRRAVIDALFRLAANRSWDEIELPDPPGMREEPDTEHGPKQSATNEDISKFEIDSFASSRR